MLYAFNSNDKLQLLAPLAGLEILENEEPAFMAAMGQISLEEASRRFLHDNKAYVAYLQGIPAAFGWMATGSATIGELDHSFILPIGHRYLWNFRTIPAFQGLGIYTRLLQHILVDEGKRADCFWIMHAPENSASGKGIRRAGFQLVGNVSVASDKRVIFQAEPKSAPYDDAQAVFDFEGSFEPQATCWNCSSPFLKKRKETCCCSAQGGLCNGPLFRQSHAESLVSV